MNQEKNITKLIEEALGSVDNIKRAEPKPFLLTRIHARMSKGSDSVWEKAGWFIARPAVAFAGLCLIVLINTMVIMVSKPSEPTAKAEQPAQTQGDEFSYSVATIYDFENAQP
jgi:hypothetical protein